MTNPKNITLVLIGHLSFIVLFSFSLFFFRERIIFSDTAFQFFKIVNFEKLNVEASRFGAILPQIPVILAMKLGVSLRWLTIIFSASFILVYYIIFLICAYLLKNIAAALSVVFVFILCISQSFFHPVTETHQSLVYSVLFYAILDYSGFRYTMVQLLLALAVMFLSFFTHPIAVYPLVFIIGYVAIDKKLFRSFKPYILFLFIGGLAIGKVLLTKENSYEGKFFSELFKTPSLILELPFAYSTKFFLQRINGLYFMIILLEIILLVYWVSKGDTTKLIWQLFLSGSFLVITLLTYKQGDSDMLMERAFMPLGLFVVIPFFKSITLSIKKYPIIKIIFLALIVISSTIRIFNTGMEFKERTRFNQEILSKTARFPNRKFIFETRELQQHHIIFWSHSFETLILSEITEDLPTQTIFPANDVTSLAKYTQNTNDIFLGADFWLEWQISNLNPRYFSLPANYPYKILRISEI